MDKDVEVSRDQNTVVVEGALYEAVTKDQLPSGRLIVCEECALRKVDTTKYAFCSFIPCSTFERKDRQAVIFKVKL